MMNKRSERCSQTHVWPVCFAANTSISPTHTNAHTHAHTHTHSHSFLFLFLLSSLPAFLLSPSFRLPLAAVCRLHSQAERLALENERMEQRLQELRSSLRKQKEEREAKGGFSWKAGRQSKISGHASAVIEEAQERRRQRAARRQGRPARAKQLPAPPSGPRVGKENSSQRRVPAPPSAATTTTSSSETASHVPSELTVGSRHPSAPAQQLQADVQSSRQRRFRSGASHSGTGSDASSPSTSLNATANGVAHQNQRIAEWQQSTA